MGAMKHYSVFYINISLSFNELQYNIELKFYLISVLQTVWSCLSNMHVLLSHRQRLISLKIKLLFTDLI